MSVEHLLVAAVAVLGVNLMPAFGPPTWAVLVFFAFRYPDRSTPALVITGAVAATTGRLLLALAFRAFGTKLPAKRRESLEVLGGVLGQSRAGLAASFAFFFGRLISYSVYVTGASARPREPGPGVREGLALTRRDRDAALRPRGGRRDRLGRLAERDRQGPRMVGCPPRTAGSRPDSSGVACRRSAGLRSHRTARHADR
jgi:hypothetical protein